jgi:hypothetical protein
MSRVSNTTRRHPRTLQEAFGPYCSNAIDDDAATIERRWHRAMYVLAFVAAVLYLVFGA